MVGHSAAGYLCVYFRFSGIDVAGHRTRDATPVFWSLYAVVDGVFSLFAAIRNWRHKEKCWLLGLEGFAGICAGAVTRLPLA
jgi:uncharacterized membrane protein HdeD (DUF308 family)